MLNWEQERRRNKPKAYPSDSLPTVGSRQDVLRWAQQNSSEIDIRLAGRRDLRNHTFKPMNQAVQQLELYVKCVQSNYFYDKPLEHRREIMTCIKRLMAKVNTDPFTSSTYARDLVKRATRLLANTDVH